MRIVIAGIALSLLTGCVTVKSCRQAVGNAWQAGYQEGDTRAFIKALSAEIERNQVWKCGPWYKPKPEDAE